MEQETNLNRHFKMCYSIITHIKHKKRSSQTDRSLMMNIALVTGRNFSSLAGKRKGNVVHPNEHECDFGTFVSYRDFGTAHR